MNGLLPLHDDVRIRRLDPPSGRPAVVLDTDAFNQIDDQFALVYAMMSREQVNLLAVYAAPFHNKRSNGPEDGMERSYEEILRVVGRLGESGEGIALRGSRSYLPAPDVPVESPAAVDLVRRAEEMSDGLLYVVAIGALTNVASALLLTPAIAERIVVVWLGGQPSSWYHTEEFNLQQDLHASRLVLDCGVPLVRVPCINVAEQMRTTLAEVTAFACGRGPIGDYLCEIFEGYQADKVLGSKVLWDLAPVAWVVNPAWVETVLVHSPVLNDGLTWSRDPRRHLIREALRVNRDEIFGDLSRKLAAAASGPPGCPPCRQCGC